MSKPSQEDALMVAAIVMNVVNGFLIGFVMLPPFFLVLVAGIACTWVVLAVVYGELVAFPVSVAAALVSGFLMTVWSGGQGDPVALISAAIALAIAIVFACVSIMSALGAFDRSL